MKTKVLKLLAYASRVFTCICISSFVIELILLVFFSDNAARHPKGTLDTINISLMGVFFFSLAMIILIPEELSKYIPEKVKKPRKPRKKGPLQIRLFGRYYPARPLFFVVLGTVCMLYCILSLPFDSIGKFDKIFRICTFAFVPVYPLIYYACSKIYRVLSKSKRDDDYDFEAGHDAAMYVIGLIIGIGIFMILGFLSLILFVVIWIVKGVIWLTNYPLPFFAIIMVLMYLLTRNSQPVKKFFSKFKQMISYILSLESKTLTILLGTIVPFFAAHIMASAGKKVRGRYNPYFYLISFLTLIGYIFLVSLLDAGINDWSSLSGSDICIILIVSLMYAGFNYTLSYLFYALILESKNHLSDNNINTSENEKA
jgi:hypothetical protein